MSFRAVNATMDIIATVITEISSLRMARTMWACLTSRCSLLLDIPPRAGYAVL